MMAIALPTELEELMNAKIQSGQYHSAGEVIRESLRLLEEKDMLWQINRQRVAGAEPVREGHQCPREPDNDGGGGGRGESGDAVPGGHPQCLMPREPRCQGTQAVMPSKLRPKEAGISQRRIWMRSCGITRHQNTSADRLGGSASGDTPAGAGRSCPKLGRKR